MKRTIPTLFRRAVDAAADSTWLLAGERVYSYSEAMDGIFGVFLPTGEDRLSAEEQALLDERQEARRNREFSQADEARRRLEEKGIVLEDTPKGTRWRRKR